MKYLILVLVALAMTINSVAQKQYNIKAKKQNIFLFAAGRQFTEQIPFQCRVFDADPGIVIRHSHIAAGVKRQIIHAALFDPVCKIFRIKISAHIRIFHLCVIVEK